MNNREMVPSRDDLRRRLDALERATRILEPGTTRRRRLRTAVVASSERFLRSIDTLPAFRDVPVPEGGLLAGGIPEEGLPLDSVIEAWEREVVEPGGNPAARGYIAYIPGGPLYHGALGDYLAAVTNKYAGVFFPGPGAVRMENQLIRWVADLVGYPAGAAGNIASGGSIANLIAITTARDARGLRAAEYAQNVVYATSHVHHCVLKALRIAGMGEAPVRMVPVDDALRMRADGLAEMIRTDREQGLTPWLVVASAGTTDTGAVDPLNAIADVAQHAGCWLHVDAAYGGFFLLTEHGRRLLAGIERSDSAVLDPHKGLFLPWGSGMVVVRDGRALVKAYRMSGSYLQDAIDAPGDVSPADVSPELTKPFRGVRMWLPLMLAGVRPFRSALEEKLLLARYFREEIRAAGFEVGPPPDLSVVTFRMTAPAASLEESNRLNRTIVDGVRRDGRVFISSTMIDDRFTLRMAALSFRTHRRTIDRAVQVLSEQAAAALA